MGYYMRVRWVHCDVQQNHGGTQLKIPHLLYADDDVHLAESEEFGET